MRSAWVRPRILFLVGGVIIAAGLLHAQQSGAPAGGGNTAPNTGAPGGGPTGAGGIGNRPGSINNPPMPGANFPGDTQNPIFLSGKVMLNDGTLPPGPVTIERVCNGTPRPEGYTDSKGRFSFQLGQDRSVIPDASYDLGDRTASARGNSGLGMRDNMLFGCEIRAVLAGYRSDVVSLAMRRSMDNPDVGTIVLHRLANVEGFTVSATSALAPKDARKAFEKGDEALKKGKLDEAQKELQKAVSLYPKYASAWYVLGRAYEQRDHLPEAREAYAQAQAADSKYINPYERLYMLDARESKWQDVADTTDRVLHLNPYDFPSAYYFNALANLQLSHLEPAEKSAREALKLDTAHANPRIGYVLGVILAQRQDFEGAAQYIREYLKVVPEGKDAEAVRKQLASIEEYAQNKAEVKTAP